MKPGDQSEFRWVGVDLHVHTPASKDYKGNCEDAEYVNLIRRANEFGPSEQIGAKPYRKTEERKPISCIAFTDHNSVEGFRKYRAMQDDTRILRNSLQTRNPGNSYLPQLEKDLETLASVRVLMGVEIKVYPGIHLLVIFHESVELTAAVAFLEQAYSLPYERFAGDPVPVSSWTVQDALNRIKDSFVEKAMVVAPHIDSSGGAYEGLKEYPQVRMALLKHPVIKALSFNRLETRERIRELYRQPEYHRPDTVALIQSSDFHGDPGTAPGQSRTDVSVVAGRASFNNLREAFSATSRVKCSIDFTREEYDKLTAGSFVTKFSSVVGDLAFQEKDYDQIAVAVGGMLNSDGGVLELEGTVSPQEERETYWTRVRNQLISLLEPRLKPGPPSFVYRDLRFSPGKIRMLIGLEPSTRLHAVNDRIPMIRNGQSQTASPTDVEAIVGRNISRRFGGRFEDTLEEMSTQAVLLSKMPRGISILLSCQDKLMFRFGDALEMRSIGPASEKGREITDQVHEFWHKASDDFPFGYPEGNTSFLHGLQPPRLEEHYQRFTVFRGVAESEVLERLAWGKVDRPAIVAFMGGGVGLIEPGYIVSDAPALLLQPKSDWDRHIYGLLGWLKSSFFVWHCAVHLGDPDLYMGLQLRKTRILLPKKEFAEFYRRLDVLVGNIILDEQKFMNEINRQKKRGALDSAEQEKARVRHNAGADGICLAIDKEIYGFLELSGSEPEFIARTLRDIRLTDFGLLAESKGKEARE